MTRIRLDVEAIHTVTLGSQYNILAIREDVRLGMESNKAQIETTFNSSLAQIEQRMANILQDEAARLEDQQRTLPAMYKNQYLVQQGKDNVASSGLAFTLAKTAFEGMGIRLNHFATTCEKGCACACYKRTASETPSFVNRVLGRAFFKYAGLPFNTPKCNSD